MDLNVTKLKYSGNLNHKQTKDAEHRQQYVYFTDNVTHIYEQNIKCTKTINENNNKTKETSKKNEQYFFSIFCPDGLEICFKMCFVF